MSFQIAIDGPVAAGKGTVSRLVAEQLGFLYVDTGAMYRLAAWLATRSKIDLKDGQAIAKMVSQTEIRMDNPDDHEKDGSLTTIKADGIDVSRQIRTEEISRLVPIVAAHRAVRRVLVRKQQEIAGSQDVVMEGRDITSVVLPDAQLKIYLTGKDDIRAQRRYLQLQSRGEPVDYQQVYKDLIERDTMDRERETDPLVKVADAWEVDTSQLSVEEVVDLIISRVRAIRDLA